MTKHKKNISTRTSNNQVDLSLGLGHGVPLKHVESLASTSYHMTSMSHLHQYPGGIGRKDRNLSQVHI